jgi:SEC-C motif
MATEAQIAANRRNAEQSTGPRSPEGKSRASRNSTTFGIYSAGDFVRPAESPDYQLFCESFQQALRPAGALEQTLAAEIVHAAWKLRRCSVIESDTETTDLTQDPLIDPAAADTRRTIDRARGEAQRQMLRAAAELRRLQTDRQLRIEHLHPGFDAYQLGGLASVKDLQSALIRIQKLNNGDAMSQIIQATEPPTKRTQSAPEPHPESAVSIPRSAPCPCGSGQKYKRCCGHGAPAVLQTAA